MTDRLDAVLGAKAARILGWSGLNKRWRLKELFSGPGIGYFRLSPPSRPCFLANRQDAVPIRLPPPSK